MKTLLLPFTLLGIAVAAIVYFLIKSMRQITPNTNNHTNMPTGGGGTTTPAQTAYNRQQAATPAQNTAAAMQGSGGDWFTSALTAFAPTIAQGIGNVLGLSGPSAPADSSQLDGTVGAYTPGNTYSTDLSTIDSFTGGTPTDTGAIDYNSLSNDFSGLNLSTGVDSGLTF